MDSKETHKKKGKSLREKMLDAKAKHLKAKEKFEEARKEYLNSLKKKGVK